MCDKWEGCLLSDLRASPGSILVIQNTLQQKKLRPTKAVRFLLLLKSLFFSRIMLSYIN